MRSGFMARLINYFLGNMARYNELIGQLTRKPDLPNAPSTVQLFVWIMSLSDCVSQLDKTCHELVTAVLQVDWSVRSLKFVDTYIRFLKNLVSAHSFYVVAVLSVLVGGFRFRFRLPAYSTTTRTVTYARCHEALEEILALIPTASNSLIVCIQRHMPYKQRSTADQAAYIKNILNIMNYASVLRKQIMGLLVEHLIKIDAHIQIELDDMNEDVEFDTYNMNFDEDYESENSDDDSVNGSDDPDNVDSEVDSDFEDANGDKADKHTKQMRQIKSMVRRLDTLMQLVFTYFSSNTSLTTHADIYPILLDSFDRTILKTLRSRYTQFLLFYICSMDPSYTDGFLAHLFQHLTDPLRPNVTRIAAAAYISSYVARAKFMTRNTIQQAMANLSEWCNSLLDQYEATMGPGLTTGKHEVFYASVQAIMYIFCFRWRDLQDDDDDELVMEGINDTTTDDHHKRKWCPGLRHINRLLTSRLHPLKVCSAPVVRQFVKIALQVNYMYLYSYLEKTNKEPLILPGINVNVLSETGAHNLLHTMQTFFPF
ncbi:RNA polymerase I-specific transcription initiation factor RRN3, partial [Chlamydoabsidia padenii]